jgi:hypothetical protein
LYDFDETRLVDQDKDGWLEYIPRGSVQGSNGMTPPFVYFDFSGYTQIWSNKTSPAILGYPLQRTGDPNGQMSQLASAWGVAVPYAQSLVTSGTPYGMWINPGTCQIISAGPDGMYGNPGSGSSGPTMRVPCFPSGFTYSIPSMTQSFFDPQELDNVTNFTSQGTIDDSSASQQGIAPPGNSGNSSSGS